MKFQKTALSVLSLGLLLAACNQVDFKKTKAGVPYKVFEGKNGRKLEIGNIAKFQVMIKIGDSIKYNSYEQMPAYQAVDSMPAGGGDAYDIQNVVMEILPKVKSTDSIYIVQTSDSIIKHHPEISVQDPTFKKGMKIVTTIKLLAAFKNQQEAQADAMKEQSGLQAKMEQRAKVQLVKDDKLLKDFLAKKGINAAKTDSGVYVQVLTPGVGPKPRAGQFMSVRYKGMSLAGEVFDSNTEPGKPVLPVQVGTGGTIKGFDNGLMQLSKGEKAILYIPSAIAYGERGAPPKIQPNQNLMFEIEVTDISDTQPAQPGMPQQPQSQPQIDTAAPGR